MEPMMSNAAKINTKVVMNVSGSKANTVPKMMLPTATKGVS